MTTNKRKTKQTKKNNKRIETVAKKNLTITTKKMTILSKKMSMKKKKTIRAKNRNIISKKNKSDEKNDSHKIQSNQIWKKNDLIELLSDMKNWKFCKNYNWTFKNDDVLSKNTIFDDKLIVKIIESNLFKNEMYKKWNYTFNSKSNLNENIDETETSAKIEFENNDTTCQSKDTLCTKMKICTSMQNEKIQRQKLTIIRQEVFFALNHKKRNYQKIT